MRAGQAVLPPGLRGDIAGLVAVSIGVLAQDTCPGFDQL